MPVGLHLAQAARLVSRRFDDALAEAGGSLPVWLVLLNLKTRRHANQGELAHAVGVTDATLTHHLNRMAADGLITRTRDANNRRIHIVELTEGGQAMFVQLRGAAVGFDRRLRAGFGKAELAEFDRMLDQLATNAVGAADASA